MRVLFVHQNFPGQYQRLAPRLAADPGNQVVVLCAHRRPLPPGLQALRYTVRPDFASGLHPWLETTETRVLMGEAAARAALELKRGGFTPDAICAHPGWGEALFLKDVWPDAPLLCYLEFFFQRGNHFGAFDPAYPERGFEAECAWRMKNSFALHGLDAMDFGVSPTQWQAAQFPDYHRPRIQVIHDGIDTHAARPDPDAFIQLAAHGLTLRPGDPVVTFAGRSLEPARGFPSFMRALPLIQRACPQARAIIVGSATASYSPALPAGDSYKQRALAEVGAQLDMGRVHFVGTLPHPLLLTLFQVSAAHVYLSYPYVLSWSMLEAMAAGCLVVGSRTPPVEEVIEDGMNGLLVDFFSPESIAGAVIRALQQPEQLRDLRANARRTVVERYDLERLCLPRQMALVRTVAERRYPGGHLPLAPYP
ncbi:Glycosyltransferase involved in cell wall bisynthesis [Methylomagnum ishizawai]|uniref:Glycosyltransferase involved in cell wall bisynthesis n=1 Tax=Methylomagnum ishizawai TaxID=1760988 RepID=A0A1Y6D4N9_9GAMM|nr:glycosyltransferase [Methylomagnum ishizawai]SMF95344.1 Glycosyltransferase involved in cell wall bisynthesis [Methylomagnum ishizawai]